MELYLLDWGNLLLRWLHVITAIAWVGSSFYFVFLDNNLIRPTSPDLLEKGVDGAMWAVHGGGFYNPQKYMVAPKKIHTHLHWFYWESYTTWLSGFALFAISYLWQAQTYLIDPNLVPWQPWQAGALALAFLVVFWLLYDLICRTLGQGPRGDLVVGTAVALVVALASWLATEWFAGRAAFLIVGAMLGTTMSANVFFVIIPGQRQVVRAMQNGQPVDPIHGKRGKQRSVHNTYFTLPVLFAMLSNHYSMVYAHAHNTTVLLVMMAAGALIRQYFVLRHAHKQGKRANPAPYAVVGVLLIAVLVVWLRPAPQAAAQAQAPVADAQAMAVLQARCVQCHNAQVQMKGVRLDTLDNMRTHALAIHQQAVVLRAMPMNNSTGITPAERDLLARWFAAR